MTSEAELSFYRALLELEVADDLASILETTRVLTHAELVHVELEHEGDRHVCRAGRGEASRTLVDLATYAREPVDGLVAVGHGHVWPLGVRGLLYVHVRRTLSDLDRARLQLLTRGLASFAEVLARRLAGRHLTLHDETRAFQRRRALDVLARSNWNVSATSRALGIARSNLYELVGDVTTHRPRRKP